MARILFMMPCPNVKILNARSGLFAQGGVTMKCNRCSGVIIPERVYGYEAIFEGWKCISCGEVFDELVLRNRQRLPKLPPMQARRARVTRVAAR